MHVQEFCKERGAQESAASGLLTRPGLQSACREKEDSRNMRTPSDDGGCTLTGMAVEDVCSQPLVGKLRGKVSQ